MAKGKDKGMMAKSEMMRPKPTMYLEDDDVIDDVSVGDEVVLQVKARCVGISEDKDSSMMTSAVTSDDEDHEGDKEPKLHKSQRYEILGVNKADKGAAAFAAKAQRAGKGVAE